MMLQQYNANIQDEEWGQHIHIDNDFTNLKFTNDYENTLPYSYSQMKPVVANHNQFQIIYNSKLPIIMKIGLYLYNFAVYFTK